MKALTLLIALMISQQALALNMEFMICNFQDDQYMRLEHHVVKGYKRITNGALTTAEKTYEQEVIEQVRTYKKIGDKRYYRYEFELADGATGHVVFEIVESNLSPETGYPQMSEGYYNGPLANKGGMYFDSCSLSKPIGDF